jgi:glucose/arabinose dehydrogenase
VFADGFAGSASPVSPGDAKYRPMGLAQGPDGSLYIGDTQTGRIWRVIYSPQH